MRKIKRVIFLIVLHISTWMCSVYLVSFQNKNISFDILRLIFKVDFNSSLHSDANILETQIKAN